MFVKLLWMILQLFCIIIDNQLLIKYEKHTFYVNYTFKCNLCNDVDIFMQRCRYFMYFVRACHAYRIVI